MKYGFETKDPVYILDLLFLVYWNFSLKLPNDISFGDLQLKFSTTFHNIEN